jgi:hypothetical protein
VKTEGSTAAAATEDTLLGIYLNDHLATLTVGVELARRAARGRQGSPAAGTLERLAAELAADRDELLDMMKNLGVPVRQYKVIAARVAERIGRLKPNGHVLNRSPLSNVVEAEGLRVAIEANASCWRTLQELADREPRLDARRLDGLLDRAQRQAGELDRCRTEAAAEAFVVPAADGGGPEPSAAEEPPGPVRITPDPARVEEPEAELPDPPTHDELPLPDYDHLPKGSLPSRIKALDRGGVEQLLSYERAHGNRLPVVLILEQRIQTLSEGAEPTSGSVTGERPEAPLAPAGASPVSPATAGPVVNPPSHGDPTNPAQPR